MEEENNIRNSTIELLRILSIILIISWHYSTQFDLNFPGGVLTSGSKCSIVGTLPPSS